MPCDRQLKIIEGNLGMLQDDFRKIVESIRAGHLPRYYFDSLCIGFEITRKEISGIRQELDSRILERCQRLGENIESLRKMAFK